MKVISKAGTAERALEKRWIKGASQPWSPEQRIGADGIVVTAGRVRGE